MTADDIMAMTTGERFARLADPLPIHAIEGRQDGKVDTKEGRHSARFVLYVEAWYLAQRLDHFFPADWTLHNEALPNVTDEGVTLFAVKATLTVGGITREDIGQGKDWKQASTDAFKRAARRFGIGAELLLADALYVEVDGAGKYAKPMENPAHAYFRRHKTLPSIPAYKHADAAPPVVNERGVRPVAAQRPDEAYASEPAKPAAPPAMGPACPKCGGEMWDNRVGKKNPASPDFKCKKAPKRRGEDGCEGLIWPPKAEKAS